MIDRTSLDTLTATIGAHTQNPSRREGHDAAAAALLAIPDPIVMAIVVARLCGSLLSTTEVTWLEGALLRAAIARDGGIKPTE